MEPEDLLFAEKDGTRTSLQDVVADGLDHDYSARYPALLRLMREDSPAHRLYSCFMLAAWGVPEGIHQLIAWAQDPDSTPWAGEPVTYDRFFGVDDAFEMLADAIRVAGEIDGHEQIAELRAGAARALLAIYDRVYFARALMLVLDLDPALAALVQPAIASAVERAIAAADAGPMPFDMATQAAFLLGPLAALDDEHAARAAETLLAGRATTNRTVREVAHALGDGTGPATHAILQRLSASPSASVREDALNSLARRQAVRDKSGHVSSEE